VTRIIILLAIFGRGNALDGLEYSAEVILVGEADGICDMLHAALFIEQQLACPLNSALNNHLARRPARVADEGAGEVLMRPSDTLREAGKPQRCVEKRGGTTECRNRRRR